MAKSLSDILTENGITLTQSGNRWVAKCPFHEGDRSPSFTVYPNETYFCFGCKAWGDGVKFLVEHKGMAPDAAMDYVGHDYREKPKKQVIKIRDTAKVWPLLYQVAQKYHENLLQTPGALTYLQSRGLSPDTINKYKLGYTDGGVLKIENAFEYALAVEHGILNSKGYEMLSHRITIPNILGQDLCDFIIGRTITHDKVKYLGIRVPKPIYGLFDVWPLQTLFITEGQFDWLLLREWGLPSIVIGGTHITNVNIAILKHRNIVIVPDNDAVGLKAALDLKIKLGHSAIVLDYASMGIKDISEAATIPGGKEEFIQIVREQVPWPLDTSNPILAKSFGILSLHQSSLWT